MKKLMLLSVVALAALTSGCDTVEAGHVGVKVYLLGGDKGVDHEIVPVGKYWIGMNERLYIFPVFEQNPKYTKGSEEDSGREIEFQTREGMSVSADFSVTYTIDHKQVPVVFQKYRRGVEEINRGPLRNILRDAVNEVTSSLTVEDVYGPGKVTMMDSVQKLVQERSAVAGLNVSQVSLLGSVRLPQNVENALNSKMEATQRAQQRENELREAEAEAKKSVAQAEGEAQKQRALAEGEAQATLTKAEAQAKANKILSESLTPALIEYRKIDRWNGALPQFGGNVTPLIQVK